MKNLFLILSLFVSLSAFSQQKKWTLEECVRYALENNISIKLSELDLEAAKIDKSDALGNFIPSVNAQSSVSNNTGLSLNPTNNRLETTRFTSFSGGATSTLTLFDGLRNIRELQRAKLAALASQYSLGLMRDNIGLFVANSFLEVLSRKRNLEVLNSQIEVTRTQLDRTRELVDAGILPQGDLLQIEATIADERQRIIVAENNVRIALISLAQTLLIKDYKNFDIAEDDYEVSGSEILLKEPSEIIAQARTKRFEIRVAEENKNIAEKDAEIARGAYYPTLNSFINYNTRYADNDPFNRDFFTQIFENDGVSYGVQLSIPVLNGFAVRNQVQRREINVIRSQYQLEQAQLDLESDVYQAYLDVQAALKAYDAAQTALVAQEQAYRYATERFEVGLTNSFDFSQSKSRWENAQTEVVRTKYDYIFKLKVIELFFGVPVTDLKL